VPPAATCRFEFILSQNIALTLPVSYSEAGTFLQYARALQTFKDMRAATSLADPITALENLDPDMTCPLRHAANMLQFFSDGLTKNPRVIPSLGTVTRAVRDPKVRHPAPKSCLNLLQAQTNPPGM
jgi:hypothetical protein